MQVVRGGQQVSSPACSVALVIWTRVARCTLQAHNWRCLRCTFNTSKGVTAAKSVCTQVRSPGLTALRGGEAGEPPPGRPPLATHLCYCRTEPAVVV
jgi:hypothetical protein